jgi:hypothetical protein
VADRTDFRIDIGADFSREIVWLNNDEEPIDLTGWTAKLVCREYPGALLPVLEATTENDLLAIDGPAGTLTIDFPAAATAAIQIPAWVGTRAEFSVPYDLELTGPVGQVVRLLEGELVFARGV